MRRLHDGLLALLGLICAAYWFGNSGAGLVLLWLECRRRSAGSRIPAEPGRLDGLNGERLRFAHVGAFRIVLIGERCGRREIFRDEVSEVDWTRLRRRVLCGRCDEPGVGA